MDDCVDRFTENLSALIPNRPRSQMGAYLRILEILRCPEHARFSIKRVDSGGTTRRLESPLKYRFLFLLGITTLPQRLRYTST